MKEKVTAGTIVRTVVLVLALVNQCLSMAGHSPLPIQDEQVEVIVTNTWTVVAALLAWWKNNSFTQAALEGDTVKNRNKGMEE